jgi:hypothetical protein
VEKETAQELWERSQKKGLRSFVRQQILLKKNSEGAGPFRIVIPARIFIGINSSRNPVLPRPSGCRIKSGMTEHFMGRH